MTIVALSDVAHAVMGQAPPGRECNKDGIGTVFVKAGEFSDRYPVVREWTTKPLKMAQTGDSLVCVVGATAGKVNQAIDCAIGRSVAAVRPSDQIDSDYLYRFLDSQVLRLRENSQGAAQGVITRDMLHNLSLPLPSIEEQRRIATILDKADAVRRNHEEALGLAGEFLKSVFLEIFGDPVLNTNRYPAVPLSEFEKFITSGSRGWAKYYSEEGQIFLRIGNVGRGDLKLDDLVYVAAPNTAEAKRTRVRKNDILLSITADLGRTAVVPEALTGAHINQHLAIIRLAGISAHYVNAYLSSAGGQMQFRSLDKVGVKSGLNFSDIRSLRILVPPKSDQSKFEKVLEQNSRTVELLKKAKAEADDLCASVAQRAFRGEL
ncbi:restriction endonuclease subunit S [Defluviimonas aestuarii]|uniref:restriction endonuclease subunit S n=1 Tax=Albidovulum aestuarii TaxID=1130726 RepID=UPI00249AD0E5|nr:restriction endonuclease subunit S [Defluviimonas aestuarii]MDI3337939.1 restriction endonuclease subunit S [Defluviimonas aestuarii]